MCQLYESSRWRDVQPQLSDVDFGVRARADHGRPFSLPGQGTARCVVGKSYPPERKGRTDRSAWRDAACRPVVARGRGVALRHNRASVVMCPGREWWAPSLQESTGVATVIVKIAAVISRRSSQEVVSSPRS